MYIRSWYWNLKKNKLLKSAVWIFIILTADTKYILCYYTDKHNKLKELLSSVTNKVQIINYNDIGTTELPKEINRLLKILDNF